jgi:hypothetical protein
VSFVFLIFSFLLLSYFRQAFINLLFQVVGPKYAKTAYFLLFFPGVLLHEFSHLMVATILFVPTGEINLFPEEKRIGSIKIAKTDPVRESVIGIAPMIIGTLVILAIFLFPLNSASQTIDLPGLLALMQKPRNWIWLYLIFTVNNTMFASESDRRSWLGLVILVGLVVTSLYLFGVFSIVAWQTFYYLQQAARLIAVAYFSTFFVNLVFIMPLFSFRKIIEKLR